jgi:muramoyltetrapeptide carboxypeptidase
MTPMTPTNPTTPNSEPLPPLKPRALPLGATLAVVSPASTPKPDRVQAGVECLEALGYAVHVFPHALQRGPLYYAGAIEQRVADLHAAFADPEIDAILCTRGGWGSAELLPYLDAAIIRANPKIFVAYSDHTSLHLWLARHTGLITFHGPMVAADFARPNGFDAASWGNALTSAEPWSLGAGDGLRILRPGHAEGTLTGGCLSILAESLATPYAFPPADAGHPRILFLEDIGTKPYQWDRMLLHLRYAGLLDHVTGIVFGDMRQCAAPEEMPLLEQAILHALREYPGPIAIGLRSGHVDGPNITLPLGLAARLDLTTREIPRLDILEAATATLS